MERKQLFHGIRPAHSPSTNAMMAKMTTASRFGSLERDLVDEGAPPHFLPLTDAEIVMLKSVKISSPDEIASADWALRCLGRSTPAVWASVSRLVFEPAPRSRAEDSARRTDRLPGRRYRLFEQAGAAGRAE